MVVCFGMVVKRLVNKLPAYFLVISRDLVDPAKQAG